MERSICSKMASEAISEHQNLKNFLGEHAPRPPLVFHAYEVMHAYWHARIHVTVTPF